MIWYPHLFQNFPQFIVIHTVKGFGIVNKAEIDAFLELFTVRVTQILIPKGSEFYFWVGGMGVLIGAPEHPLGVPDIVFLVSLV